ncbi:MAG: DNA (cytosine-5-)-methyltransferase [Steroidobacteraceae bacterium]
MRLSIEKDEQAHKTLQLRTFFRLFPKTAPADYYRLLRREISLKELYDLHPVEAELASDRCWHATLGPDGESAVAVRSRIKKAVGNDSSWILIGGPPCQAYSLAGRSRNHGNPKYNPVKDARQRLYVEYLQILAEHRPAVFIMENVKGLLSATLENERVFHRILEDLRDPAAAVVREGRGGIHSRKGGYRIHSLIEDSVFEDGTLEGSVIRAEIFGVPQKRHRVILLGIRDDITGVKPRILRRAPKPVSASRILNTLPRLRGGLSPKAKDSPGAWRDFLQAQATRRWFNAGTRKVDSLALSKLIRRKLRAITLPAADRGSEFISGDFTIAYRPGWFCDARIGGVCNHSSRAHMGTDLLRYFYAACYAKRHGKSPSLKHFPTDLLPNHGNVSEAIESGSHFSDRFRVQVGSRPSTTIVSHISKDGHYYIHPDPLQCRSLTVREAARLQTFPDNYLFCGNRTSQYIQVGNAVPPLLAKQIGEIVRDFLKAAGLNN